MDWFISHFDPLFMLLGSLTGFAGLALVYAAWRKSQRQPALLWAAWLLLGLGSALWITAARFDTGLALAITLWMLAALITVLANGQWRQKTAGKNKKRADVSLDGTLPDPNVAPSVKAPSLPVLQSAVVNFLLAGPLAFVFALSVSLVLFAVAPWQEATRIMASAILVIFIWAATMVWVSASARRVGGVVVMSLSSALSLLLLQWL